MIKARIAVFHRYRNNDIKQKPNSVCYHASLCFYLCQSKILKYCEFNSV